MYPYTYAPGPETAQLTALVTAPTFGTAPDGRDPARDAVLQMILQDRQARQQAALYRDAMMHAAARQNADQRILARVLGRAQGGSDPVGYLQLLAGDPAIAQAAQRAVLPSLLLADIVAPDPDQTRAQAIRALQNLSGVGY